MNDDLRQSGARRQSRPHDMAPPNPSAILASYPDQSPRRESHTLVRQAVVLLRAAKSG